MSQQDAIDGGESPLARLAPKDVETGVEPQDAHDLKEGPFDAGPAQPHIAESSEAGAAEVPGTEPVPGGVVRARPPQ
jgi:hypothetical protein